MMIIERMRVGVGSSKLTGTQIGSKTSTTKTAAAAATAATKNTKKIEKDRDAVVKTMLKMSIIRLRTDQNQSDWNVYGLWHGWETLRSSLWFFNENN